MKQKNNRRHVRIESQHLLSYMCRDDQGQLVCRGMGRTLNVSQSGIMLETHVPLEIENNIWLTIGIEDSLLEIQGRAVYSQFNESSGRYQTGIHFEGVDAKTKDLLVKYIRIFREQEAILQTIGIKLPDDSA